MESKKLVSNLTEKEQKLLQEVASGKEDYQVTASDGEESYINIDLTVIDQASLFIGYLNKEEKFCKGRYGEKNFALTEDSGLLRVISDCRIAEDIRFHVNNKGTYAKLSNDSDNDESLMIVYIESPTFVQLSLYDGKLQKNKVSHILTTKPTLKSRIRTIAYSILNQHFCSFQNTLRLMDDGDHEAKK